MQDHRMSSAPNYTNPALIMLGANLLWIFTLVWSLYGFVIALLLATSINHMVERLARARGTVPICGFLTDRRGVR